MKFENIAKHVKGNSMWTMDHVMVWATSRQKALKTTDCTLRMKVIYCQKRYLECFFIKKHVVIWEI